MKDRAPLETITMDLIPEGPEEADGKKPASSSVDIYVQPDFSNDDGINAVYFTGFAQDKGAIGAATSAAHEASLQGAASDREISADYEAHTRESSKQMGRRAVNFAAIDTDNLYRAFQHVLGSSTKANELIAKNAPRMVIDHLAKAYSLEDQKLSVLTHSEGLPLMRGVLDDEKVGDVVALSPAGLDNVTVKEDPETGEIIEKDRKHGVARVAGRFGVNTLKPDQLAPRSWKALPRIGREFLNIPKLYKKVDTMADPNTTRELLDSIARKSGQVTILAGKNDGVFRKGEIGDILESRGLRDRLQETTGSHSTPYSKNGQQQFEQAGRVLQDMDVKIKIKNTKND